MLLPKFANKYTDSEWIMDCIVSALIGGAVIGALMYWYQHGGSDALESLTAEHWNDPMLNTKQV